MANLTLDEKVKYLIDRTKYMERLSTDEDYLFSELNSLDNSVLAVKEIMLRGVDSAMNKYNN